MANSNQTHAELSRELTLFDITMMGLGMMIGAGVFIGMGPTIGTSGPGGVMLTFALNGLVALFTAFSYAELSSAFPRTGGAYHFARHGFGRGPSFVAGWMEWFASAVAGSLYAVTFAIYVVKFLKEFDIFAKGDPRGIFFWIPMDIFNCELMGVDHFWIVKPIALLVAILFIAVNFKGASETGRLGAIMTLGQTAFLWIIGAIGVWIAINSPERLANFSPFLSNGWSMVLATMGATYVAFEGYEVIAQAADETIDPKRNLPKAMIYSVLIVTFTYVLVAFAVVAAVPAAEIGGSEVYQWIGARKAEAFGDSVTFMMPRFKLLSGILVTLAVIFASTSALNATVFSATRAIYALGRDGMLPKALSKIHPQRKTPWVALLVTAALVLTLAMLRVDAIAICASMMFLGLFFLVNICVIRIRQNMGDELSYGFVMPLYPVTPILAIILQGMLVFWIFKHEISGGHEAGKDHAPQAAAIEAAEPAVHAETEDNRSGSNLTYLFIFPGWIVIGIIVYFAYGKHHVIHERGEVMVFEEEKQPSEEGYRIMASFANPGNAVDLVGTMYKLCGAKEAGHVELLHMVPVPDQTPLHDAEEYMWEGKEAIAEAQLYLQPAFPVSTTLRYCRNIARGIIGAVRQKKINMLLMGWHGEQRTIGFSLGSTVDPIIERAPCDVVIVKGKCNRAFKKILVPVSGGPNGALAMDVANIMADDQVTVMSVVNEHHKFDLTAFIDELAENTGLSTDNITPKLVESDYVVAAILKELKDHDAIVLGCTQRPMIYRMTHESIPEVIARRSSDKPVIMVSAAHGIKSWIKRWI